jgi:hemerythrin-like metal-binding protein
VLFGLAAELSQAMGKGQGKAALGKVLDRLITYTVAHFAEEERLMERYRYPRLVAHKAEHEALTKKVRQLSGEMEKGAAILTVDVMDFLESWLTKHIQHSDMQYAIFINRKAAA